MKNETCLPTLRLKTELTNEEQVLLDDILEDLEEIFRSYHDELLSVSDPNVLKSKGHEFMLALAEDVVGSIAAQFYILR